MIIFMAATRNWYQYLAVEVYALLHTNNITKIYLFIEDDDIPYIKDNKVEFINCNKIEEIIKPISPNYNTKYTKMTFARLYIPKLIKEDKVLYIDADAIVNDNINELWELDLGDNVIAGVHEPGNFASYINLENINDTYINSGVMLMDLEKIREQKLDDKMINIINNFKYPFPDQDAINIVLQGKIQYISNIYNSTETTGYNDDAKIYHYIRERKGWLKTSPRSEIWFAWYDKWANENKRLIAENYKCITLTRFNDVVDNVTRSVGQIFNCTKNRYLYLLEHNAVELVEIQKI